MILKQQRVKAMDFDVLSPRTSGELLEAVAANRDRNFRIAAGGTDVLMELKRQPEENLVLINLGRLRDPVFNSIQKTGEGMRIGSLVTAKDLLDSEVVKQEYPVLRRSAYQLASAQIRQVATVGGNLCTASPSGDIACALMALKAGCEIVNTDGEARTVPLADFFTGVRQTVLRRHEVLRSVTVPANLPTCLPDRQAGLPTLYSDFIKVGTRLSMECSVVSLAYHVQLDANGIIGEAGIAVGSVAPVIRFAAKAVDFILNKPRLNEVERDAFAARVLEYASPISDIRASAWYRETVLYNIAKGVFE